MSDSSSDDILVLQENSSSVEQNENKVDGQPSKNLDSTNSALKENIIMNLWGLSVKRLISIEEHEFANETLETISDAKKRNIQKENEILELQVHLMDQSYRIVNISKYQTVSGLRYQFSKMISCKYPEYFHICIKEKENEYNAFSEEKWLDLNKTLMDQSISNSTHLYFKMKYIKIPKLSLDSVTLDIIFTQLNQDIIHGRYGTVPERLLIYLAALNLQSSFGNVRSYDQVLEKNMNTLFPIGFDKEHPTSHLRKRIINIHHRLLGLGSEDAKLAYIRLSCEIPLFGSTIFHMKQGNIDVKVFLNDSAIVIYKIDKMTMLEWINLNGVYEWNILPDQGCSIKYFKSYHDNEDKVNVKIKFSCSPEKAEAFTDLLKGYVYLLEEESEMNEKGVKNDIAVGKYLLPFQRNKYVMNLTSADRYIHTYRLECIEKSLPIFLPFIELLDNIPLHDTFTDLNLSNTDLDAPSSEGILYGFDAFYNEKDINLELKNFNIHRLDVSMNRISPSFCRILNHLPSLTYLNISHNGFTKYDALPLSLLLSHTKNLESFHYRGNNLKDKCSKPLIEKLGEIKTLKILDLSQNELKSADALAALFYKLQSFDKLVLKENRLNDSSIDRIMEVIAQQNASLNLLDIRSNAINGKCLGSIYKTLSAHPDALKKLKIAGNNITQTKYVCELARQDISLILDVGLIPLGKKEWKEFLKAFSENPVLHELHITGGFLKYGWQEFATHIPLCKNLMTLHMKKTVIASLPSPSLSVISQNPSLRYVDLSGCDFGKHFPLFMQAMTASHSILHLSLKNCKLNDSSASALAQYLHDNTYLISLNLDNNEIGDIGSEEIAESLVLNESLEELSMANNTMEGQCLDAWFSTVCKNSTLMTLDLQGNLLAIDVDIIRHIENLPSLCIIKIE